MSLHGDPVEDALPTRSFTPEETAALVLATLEGKVVMLNCGCCCRLLHWWGGSSDYRIALTSVVAWLTERYVVETREIFSHHGDWMWYRTPCNQLAWEWRVLQGNRYRRIAEDFVL